MKRLIHNRIPALGASLLCGLGIALLSGGCSRNIASVPDSPLAASSSSHAPAAPPASDSEETGPVGAVPDSAPKASDTETEIAWNSDLDDALAQAQKTQTPVMIDFYATWCGPCKLLDEKIYPTADVVREAQNFITVKIDVDQQQALARKYQVSGLPTIVFLDPSGRELHRQSGIDGRVESFVQLMQTAHSKFTPSSI